MENYQVVFKKKSIIDGADEVENSWYTDAVCRNGLPFLKVSIRWQILLADGADFYVNCKGWKKSVKRKSLPEIALSHWDSIMIQTLTGEKQISRYPPDEELRILIYDTYLLQKRIKQYNLGHIRQVAI